jgi:hypothetical protein
MGSSTCSGCGTTDLVNPQRIDETRGIGIEAPKLLLPLRVWVIVPAAERPQQPW